ncbi:MAG TPA: hypothetical protein VJC12_01405 [Candidatus Paceibacterota bacterium]
MTNLHRLPITWQFKDSIQGKQAFDRAINEEIDGFVLNNEDPSVIRNLLGLIFNSSSRSLHFISKPEKVLAIASGGDCLLLGILPYVANVVAVDLGYASIAATAVKAALLRRYQTTYIKQQILKLWQDFREAVDEELIEAVPQEIRARGFDSYNSIFTSYSEERVYSDFDGIKIVWCSTPDWVYEKARMNLGGLQLEHGSLNSQRVAVDLVYASNICDLRWTGRLRFPFMPLQLLRNLRYGGYLLVSNPISPIRRFGTELVAQLPDNGCWTYALYKKVR